MLLLNGQEVGEPGTQAEGYQLADGRTTVFDYWAMPEFVKWVNGGRCDGGVVANFRPGAAAQGRIRIPQELVTAARLTGDVSVQLLLDREGRCDVSVATVKRRAAYQ